MSALPSYDELWPGLAGYPLVNAGRFPGRVAYAHGTELLTWHDVERRAVSIASILSDHGVGSTGRVAILGRNDPTWVCAEFALWRLGAVPVLVHSALPPEVLLNQLTQAAVGAVLAGPDVSEAVLRGCADSGVPVFVWGRAEAPSGTVRVDAPRPGAEVPYAAVRSDDIAMIAYSSGTTGDPKGTVIRYRHVAARLLTVHAAIELASDDVGMVIGPLFMGGTQNLSLIPYAAAGVTCVIAAGSDGSDILRDIDSWGVTTFFGVPTLLTKLLAARGDVPAGTSLRRVVSAGAALPPALYRAFVEAFGAGVYEVCGTFETGGGLAITEGERQAGKATSVGRPMLGYLVGLRDEFGQEIRSPGVRGELTYGGPAVSYEYFNRPRLDATIAADGMFRSGDVGYRDEDGYYYIVDRIKDVITSGGQNVYPAEIEAVLGRLAGVRECAVIGVPDEKWGEAVHAVLSVAPGAALTSDDVVAFARTQLAGYQVPKAVTFVGELPKTAVGKVAKRVLRSRFGAPLKSSGVES